MADILQTTFKNFFFRFGSNYTWLSTKCILQCPNDNTLAFVHLVLDTKKATGDTGDFHESKPMLPVMTKWVSLKVLVFSDCIKIHHMGELISAETTSYDKTILLTSLPHDSCRTTHICRVKSIRQMRSWMTSRDLQIISVRLAENLQTGTSILILPIIPSGKLCASP